MISLVLNVDPDGIVSMSDFSWLTAEEDGFSPEGVESLETTLIDLLEEAGTSWRSTQALMLVTNHLFENYYGISSRVVILHDGVVFSGVEYNVIGKVPILDPKPEPEPITRVSRYNRNPVI